MIKNRLIPIYIFLLLLASGCSYTINCSIQKSESFITQTKELSTIFYLRPQVSVFRIDGYKKDDYSLVIASENEMNTVINKLTKKILLFHSWLQLSN